MLCVTTDLFFRNNRILLPHPLISTVKLFHSFPTHSPSAKHLFHVFKCILIAECKILRTLITNISTWINKNKCVRWFVVRTKNRNSADHAGSDCRKNYENCTYRISVIGPWSKFHEARLLVEWKIPVIVK